MPESLSLPKPKPPKPPAQPRLRPPRHRPSEPLAPRASDLIASRLAALAAWARQQSVVVVVDGQAIDAARLAAIAHEHAHSETALARAWRAFQALYVPHTERARRDEAFLLRVVDAIERMPGARLDAKARTALRTCKLRTPPKALGLSVAITAETAETAEPAQAPPAM
jgi:hypothetical protein